MKVNANQDHAPGGPSKNYILKLVKLSQHFKNKLRQFMQDQTASQKILKDTV